MEVEQMAKDKSKMSKEEIKWQTEDDVRILEKYSELLGDQERLNRAREALKTKNKNINKVLNIK